MYTETLNNTEQYEDDEIILDLSGLFEDDSLPETMLAAASACSFYGDCSGSYIL